MVILTIFFIDSFETKSRFRWDYFDKYHEKTGGELVGFKKFMEAGVRSEYLKSVFPAESFPAWQTIQTGLFCGEKNSFDVSFAQASTQRPMELLATSFMTER